MKLQSISYLLSQIAKISHFHVPKHKERKPPRQTTNLDHNGGKNINTKWKYVLHLSG